MSSFAVAGRKKVIRSGNQKNANNTRAIKHDLHRVQHHTVTERPAQLNPHRSNCLLPTAAYEPASMLLLEFGAVAESKRILRIAQKMATTQRTMRCVKYRPV
jgi:hypothetical protein